MANSSFTPTVQQNPITVVVPGVSDGLVSLNGVPGRSSGSVPTGYIGEDQSASLTAFFTQNPAGNNAWNDIPGSSITITQAGKFMLTVDVPVYFSISGGNTNSNYIVQAGIRTAGPTTLASSSFAIYVSAGSLINTSLITIPITTLVTATTGTQYFLSVRYFYGGGAADAGTKDVGIRGDTNNFVFRAIRIA